MMSFTWVLVLLCGGGVVVGQDPRSIYQYLQDENYSKFLELVIGAGLSSQFLDLNSSPITLFAPTDAAFSELSSETQIALQSNDSYLKTVLNGHVSQQTILGMFIRDGLVQTSESGTSLRFNVYPNSAKTVNGAAIGGNVILSNGVVHSINKVLLPLDRSIATIVAETDDQFRDLFGLLVLAKQYGTLSVAGPYTLFAPDDSAFAAEDVASLVSNRTALEVLLKDHIVSGQYWSAGLSDGMTLPTLGGSQLTMHTGPVTFVNHARVKTFDMGASNGVIHVLASVITPQV